jgi:ribosomal protein L29
MKELNEWRQESEKDLKERWRKVSSALLREKMAEKPSRLKKKMRKALARLATVLREKELWREKG